MPDAFTGSSSPFMVSNFSRVLRLLAILLLIALSPAQAAEPRIGVMTMQPGQIFWERFGHNAIVVDDGKTQTSYNFGFFDPSEPGFVGHFIQGRMNYLMAALPLAQDLNYYRTAGRGVSIQWLDLSAAQKQTIIVRLQFLSLPENARYRYDYFTNNCATQVRDVLDLALAGQLQKQWTASSLGNTYRSETVRLAWPAKWMALGFDLGLSARADKPLNRWQDAFIPMRLADSLAESRTSPGKPLVLETETLLPNRIAPPPEELPQWPITALLTGLALAGVFFTAIRLNRTLANSLMLGFWLLGGLAGCIMLGLWLFTEHRFAHGNENLLLMSPMALTAALLYAVRKKSAFAHRLYVLSVRIVAGSAVAAVLFKLLGAGNQVNMNWLLLLLPLHWLMAKHALAGNDK